MKSSFPNNQWPPILVGKSATVAALLSEIKKIHYLTKAELIEKQSSQLKQIIIHHFMTAQCFRKRMQDQKLSYKDIKAVEDLRKILPITKKHVQSIGDKFYSSSIPKEHYPVGQAKTSGSTGQPIAVAKTAVNSLFWEAHTMLDHEWHNRNYKLRMASVRATIDDTVQMSNWGIPASQFYETGKSLGMNVSLPVDQIITRLKDFDPEILTIHAGVFSAIVSHWERHGYDFNIKHLKNIGDTVSADLRKRWLMLSGLPIEDVYSSSEAGCIAIECEHQHYHVMSDSLIVEILRSDNSPCDVGEIGRVVVTDLHNTAAPLIRYDLGDYAEVGSTCACGRTTPTLTKIVGRERNLFHTPDGRKFWPRPGMYEIQNIVPVRQWQLIQHSIRNIECKLVTDMVLTESQKENIISIISKIMMYDCEITINDYRNTISTNNGKFEESICLIK